MRTVEDMTCKECGKQIMYDYAYSCYECNNCGSCYNVVGNSLAPKSQWRDEYDNEDYDY